MAHRVAIVGCGDTGTMRQEAAESEDQGLPAGVERVRLSELSHRGSGGICSQCGKPTLVRNRLPAILRPLRRLGIDLRSYECAYCGRRTFLRRRD